PTRSRACDVSFRRSWDRGVRHDFSVLTANAVIAGLRRWMVIVSVQDRVWDPFRVCRAAFAAIEIAHRRSIRSMVIVPPPSRHNRRTRRGNPSLGCPVAVLAVLGGQAKAECDQDGAEDTVEGTPDLGSA